MITISLEILNQNEYAIIGEAIAKIFAAREQSPSVGFGSANRRAELNAAYAEAANDPHFEAAQPAVQEAVETPPPPTEAETIAAVTAATQRGVGMPEIVGFLTKKGVQKIPQLSPEDRTEFVTWLKTPRGTSV